MKSSLVRTHPILTEKKIIQAGEAYLGSVWRVGSSKVLVEFFGGRIEEIKVDKAKHGGSAASSYKIGQVVSGA